MFVTEHNFHLFLCFFVKIWSLFSKLRINSIFIGVRHFEYIIPKQTT